MFTNNLFYILVVYNKIIFIRTIVNVRATFFVFVFDLDPVVVATKLAVDSIPWNYNICVSRNLQMIIIF